jgi:aminoglycoside phosphotransferase (APT) family kinase protein
VPGAGPLSIEPVGSGLVNRSYRVRREGRSFLLRLGAPRAAQLGLDRAWECRVLRCAAGAALAPPVERCEPRSSVLVTHWVEGSAWSADPLSATRTLDQVALLVRRVQDLPALEAPRTVSVAQWIAFYRRTLDRCEDRPAPRQDSQRPALDVAAQARLESLAREPAEPGVLCHSDLHPQNLLTRTDGAPMILDWEYAHVAERFWDLAGWASNVDLTDQRRETLLACYLQRDPRPEEVTRLGRLAWLYDYVCLLWSEVYLASQAHGGVAAAGVAARARRLEERLQREASGCDARVPAH